MRPDKILHSHSIPTNRRTRNYDSGRKLGKQCEYHTPTYMRSSKDRVFIVCRYIIYQISLEKSPFHARPSPPYYEDPRNVPRAPIGLSVLRNFGLSAALYPLRPSPSRPLLSFLACPKPQCTVDPRRYAASRVNAELQGPRAGLHRM